MDFSLKTSQIHKYICTRMLPSSVTLRLLTDDLKLELVGPTNLHRVPQLRDDLGHLLDPLVHVGADGAEDLHEGLHEGRRHPRAAQQVLAERAQVGATHLVVSHRMLLEVDQFHKIKNLELELLFLLPVCEKKNCE